MSDILSIISLLWPLTVLCAFISQSIWPWIWSMHSHMPLSLHPRSLMLPFFTIWRYSKSLSQVIEFLKPWLSLLRFNIFPCLLKTGAVIKQKKPLFFSAPTQEKNIAIRMIPVLRTKLLMLFALTWLWVTSSKRGANWETTLPANSVQLMHYLLSMINWIRMCLYVSVSNSRHLYLHQNTPQHQVEKQNCLVFTPALLKWLNPLQTADPQCCLRMLMNMSVNSG